jgi:hypothetical protein
VSSIFVQKSGSDIPQLGDVISDATDEAKPRSGLNKQVQSLNSLKIFYSFDADPATGDLAEMRNQPCRLAHPLMN